MQQAEENAYRFVGEMGVRGYDGNLMEGLFLQKMQMQDQRIEELSKKFDEFNYIVNIESPDWNKYIRRYPYETPVSKDRMNDNRQNNLLSNITAETQKLKGLDDIRDQIAHCASVCDATLNVLKNYHICDDSNYSKRLLHLFYQVIKRNYAKFLFTDRQVEVMVDMVKTVKSPFVDADKYWEFDEMLYSIGLNSFPEEE